MTKIKFSSHQCASLNVVTELTLETIEDRCKFDTTFPLGKFRSYTIDNLSPIHGYTKVSTD